MDLKPIADQFNIPFFHVPFTKDNKESGEKQQIEFEKYEINFIVLARYMQIITPNLISLYENKIINIHHSFTGFSWLNPITLLLKERKSLGPPVITLRRN
jgi:formyltetrahydrofolate deformylase